MEKAAGFGWLRLFCIQLAPMQLIRRMGAGLVIVYGLGLIHPLPPTVRYLCERNVVEAFYGINQPECTMEEIGKKYGLTRERVRQIREKAIRKLKQNTKNKMLKAYLGR